MKRLGHARTDILFSRDTDKSNAIREDLLRRYGIPKDKKLVLYAPTHRKGLKMKDLALDYPDLTKTLSEKFGGEYVVMLRIHDKTKKILDKGLIWTDELRQVLYNVTDYPDIQELMMVTDIGITDYSSWIYDYVNMTTNPICPYFGG
jgi:CDP-glycerol glycerophosphotransferase